jgi:hypothetical protein
VGFVGVICSGPIGDVVWGIAESDNEAFKRVGETLIFSFGFRDRRFFFEDPFSGRGIGEEFELLRWEGEVWF